MNVAAPDSAARQPGPQVLGDVALERLNTFGLPARASRLVRITDGRQVADLGPLIADGPPVVLGGGSNTVFVGDVQRLVVHVAIPGRRLVAEDADGWVVEAGAGEPWHDFVRWTLAQGWPGLENLSLIPGTVGAAPIQNIGAYGVELTEVFDSLDAVELSTGRPRVFRHVDCAFGYRDSVFKQHEAGRWLITAVRFRLPRRWVPRLEYGDLASELERAGPAGTTATAVSDAVIAIRRRKLPDPAVLGNAGSFFKNPLVGRERHQALLARYPGMPGYLQPDGRVKLAAGWLIEQCGWKGRDLGPVGAYEKQALVLVNRGAARGSDVCRLAEAIRAEVRARFGVELEVEPVFVGG